MPTVSFAFHAIRPAEMHEDDPVHSAFIPLLQNRSFDFAQDDWWRKTNEEQRVLSAWYLENHTTALRAKGKQANRPTAAKIHISLRSKWRLTASLRRFAPSDAVRLHTPLFLPRGGAM